MIYSVDHLHLWLNDQHILDDIHFQFPQNSITAIVGPSGSGKSSFLQTLHRLHEPSNHVKTSGDIYTIESRDQNHNLSQPLSPQSIGSVFQNPTPFPMSIWKNIELPLKEMKIPKPQRKTIIEQALKDVGLFKEVAHRLNSSALALSGGQQQRLCIARAIALKPKLLLMDEPCSALDPIASQVIERLILTLKKNYTLIIVTHNLSQAKRIADQIGFFWSHHGKGQMLEFKTADEIFESPSHPLTQHFLEYESFARI